MKTFNKTTEITYSAVEIQDVITMLPLMKDLADEFKSLHEKVNRDGKPMDYQVAKYRQLGNQLFILLSLGFCTPNVDDIQFDPRYFDFK